jgi:hypothetical protein
VKRASTVLLALAAGAAATAALPQQAEQPAAGGTDAEDSESSAAPLPGRTGRFELKRQMTSNGTSDESTKTILRLDWYLSGPVSVLRLDVPMPDEAADFNGDPLQPRLGDIKTRVAFRPLKSGELAFLPFVELTFPTADPESHGTGKYQLSAAVRILDRVRVPFLDAAAHRTAFETQVQQVVSVAGDAERKDINTTKLEFTLYDIWRGKYTTKLRLKPNIDWVRDGKTGAVGEIEGGQFFAEHWRVWLMLGTRLWGPDDIHGTYGKRAELGLSRGF